MHRARIAFAAFSAALTILASPAAHAAGPYANVAIWGGRAFFPDCGGGSVCVEGTTASGYCEDKVGLGSLRINQCRAWIVGSYAKQGQGSVPLCVGVGNGFVMFTDSSGQTFPDIPVVLAASDGVITYSGRYVDAFGKETFAVHGVIGAACGRNADWVGALDTFVG
jgi:hypothetical protein